MDKGDVVLSFADSQHEDACGACLAAAQCRFLAAAAALKWFPRFEISGGLFFGWDLMKEGCCLSNLAIRCAFFSCKLTEQSGLRLNILPGLLFP